ncbi:hypothetical protein ANCCAN_02361 [Ancylostoma caninum]|uniref:Uncharacterized protein n=1 Tax=Ancylostoma caninum TaxID=29170 RepID=A0A368H477_ANCCA|nr:hypothetical protein ANCCAN_02361 [Ancylostoma caninum]
MTLPFEFAHPDTIQLLPLVSFTVIIVSPIYFTGIWFPSDRPRFRDIQCLCPLILLLTRRSTVNWGNPVSSVSVDRVAVMSFWCQLSSFRDPTSDQLLPTP